MQTFNNKKKKKNHFRDLANKIIINAHFINYTITLSAF